MLGQLNFRFYGKCERSGTYMHCPKVDIQLVLKSIVSREFRVPGIPGSGLLDSLELPLLRQRRTFMGTNKLPSFNPQFELTLNSYKLSYNLFK